jgi:hypothetical protein
MSLVRVPVPIRWSFTTAMKTNQTEPIATPRVRAVVRRETRSKRESTETAARSARRYSFENRPTSAMEWAGSKS